MDEKAKLISGKNGSQVDVIHQMPTLDPDPDTNVNDKLKSDEKTSEGGNGKIVNKPVEKTNEDLEKKNEGIVEKSESKEKQVADENLDIETAEPRWIETSDGQIEIEDPDDYLIYLDDILMRIHK